MRDNWFLAFLGKEQVWKVALGTPVSNGPNVQFHACFWNVTLPHAERLYTATAGILITQDPKLPYRLCARRLSNLRHLAAIHSPSGAAAVKTTSWRESL